MTSSFKLIEEYCAKVFYFNISSFYCMACMDVFTSRVSGRGNRIGAVFLCVCVCALSRPNCLTYDLDYCLVFKCHISPLAHNGG